MTRLTPDEMARRREEGLCFNCPEKFLREHLKHCTMKGLYLLDAGDDASDTDPEISLNALSGLSTG